MAFHGKTTEKGERCFWLIDSSLIGWNALASEWKILTDSLLDGTWLLKNANVEWIHEAVYKNVRTPAELTLQQQRQSNDAAKQLHTKAVCLIKIYKSFNYSGAEWIPSIHWITREFLMKFPLKERHI